MLNRLTSHAEQTPPYHIPMETMGDRIRTLRQARGLSQGRLADRLGVTTGAVSQWESGNTQNIKIQTFLKLADELGTTPKYLAFGPPQRQPPPVTPTGRRQA